MPTDEEDVDNGPDERIGHEEDEEDVENGPDENVGPDEMPRDRSFAFVAPGKYEWDEDDCSSRPAPVLTEALTSYSWSDSHGMVSIGVSLEGLDAVSDHALLVDSGPRHVVLTILGIGSPPRRRRLAIHGLANEILGVQLVRRTGKDKVVLKLQKKFPEEWRTLCSSNDTSSGLDHIPDPPSFSELF
mmetsp:Transcript_11775/g.26272  ORF Transcript_11775/g.26272 Transcript_11775/m.26272 type:complete len:187 (-) Transcript_11775:96-656(-)|eukprot:CAMPEP_0170653042 /NCGR_PEP_ID=MMETSP0224-20130122/47205_1 /TAXON_ID=285029 /ORGANISM="Togula jolla, Strain CCCM 725" /LENGTH=186 /DNA_ID=CAMNT_0010984905 /DNA_START=85 /DNA_END=645 /DNA_ORIENTATION=+